MKSYDFDHAVMRNLTLCINHCILKTIRIDHRKRVSRLNELGIWFWPGPSSSLSLCTHLIQMALSVENSRMNRIEFYPPSILFRLVKDISSVCIRYENKFLADDESRKKNPIAH